MSRTGKTRAEADGGERERRPILVSIVYVLGALGAVVLVVSALFTAGGYFSSEDTTVDFSPVAVVVWGGLIVLAVATWLWRRLGR